MAQNARQAGTTLCAVQVMAFGQIGQNATQLNQPMRAGSELPASETLPNQFTSDSTTINPPNIRESACGVLLHCGGAGGHAPAAVWMALRGLEVSLSHSARPGSSVMQHGANIFIAQQQTLCRLAQQQTLGR